MTNSQISLVLPSTVMGNLPPIESLIVSFFSDELVASTVLVFFFIFLLCGGSSIHKNPLHLGLALQLRNLQPLLWSCLLQWIVIVCLQSLFTHGWSTHGQLIFQWDSSRHAKHFFPVSCFHINKNVKLEKPPICSNIFVIHPLVFLPEPPWMLELLHFFYWAETTYRLFSNGYIWWRHDDVI